MKNSIQLQTLISAYCQGIFPMSDETGEIGWYSPDPRAIIPIDSYKPSKSLRSILNKSIFEIKINKQFEQVIRNCALPRKEESGTWISEEMVQAFTQLHNIGFAHSVEAYQNNGLVGGLYGVCIGGVFFGESMFSFVSNSSKVAFHYLINILRNNDFVLLDSQFMNDNVKRYGAIEISKKQFDELIAIGITKKCEFKMI